jgi:undecaprenyl diphosphate synthase
MDGNGRWAKERGLSRAEGHKAGALTVRRLVEDCRRRGIRYLTLYAFSSENWGRPPAEISALMGLFQSYLESELDLLLQHGVRLRSMGDLEKMPPAVRALLSDREEKSKHGTELDLILALSYGGRGEILQAVRASAEDIASGRMKGSELTEEKFRCYLYCPDVPDPDLLIRTSGEFRISNFLLWQLAYTEICILPEYWPDLTSEIFEACLEQYARRDRRFGLVESRK